MHLAHCTRKLLPDMVRFSSFENLLCQVEFCARARFSRVQHAVLWLHKPGLRQGVLRGRMLAGITCTGGVQLFEVFIFCSRIFNTDCTKPSRADPWLLTCFCAASLTSQRFPFYNEGGVSLRFSMFRSSTKFISLPSVRSRHSAGVSVLLLWNLIKFDVARSNGTRPWCLRDSCIFFAEIDVFGNQSKLFANACV